jgi:hypothetical protein
MVFGSAPQSTGIFQSYWLSLAGRMELIGKWMWFGLFGLGGL